MNVCNIIPVDLDLIYNGLVALLALLGLLLIPIAVMIYEHTSSEGLEFSSDNRRSDNPRNIYTRDDVFSWERIVVLKDVAKATWLFASFIIASVALLMFSLEVCCIRLTALLLYFMACIFICIRIICLGKWLYSQSHSSTKLTYRQRKKFDFLYSLNSNVDKLNIWFIVWCNINSANPYQAEYLKIYLEGLDKMGDDSWRYMNIFLENIKSGNVNIARPDIQEILVNYSFSALNPNNREEPQIGLIKKQIAETLIGTQFMGEEIYIGTTFDLVEKYLAKHNDDTIIYMFAKLFFRHIDKDIKECNKISQLFDSFPHGKWGVMNLLANDTDSRRTPARIWLRAFLNGSRIIIHRC